MDHELATEETPGLRYEGEGNPPSPIFSQRFACCLLQSEQDLALADLWLDKAKAGSDDGTFVFVAALVILAMSLGVREWLTNRDRPTAPQDRGETERGARLAPDHPRRWPRWDSEPLEGG